MSATAAGATVSAGAFRVEWWGGRIAHLVMDDPARKVNVLDEAAFAGLEAALAELESGSPAGVLVRSGKSGSFIAGADVEAIGAMSDREQVKAVIRRAHAAFQRLASLRCPTVAVIDGVCLGGGTELALACDSRLATDEPRTQIGLPEVMLGIFPGFGGATRLPRLVGLRSALDLILTGRSLDARRAERIGLIHRTVPAAWMIEHGTRRLSELAALKAPARRDAYRPRALADWLLESTPIGRAIVFNQAESMTRARTQGRFPAPLAALEVLKRSAGRPIEVGLALEVERVSELVVSPVCKNLVRIFGLQERARKDAVTADPSVQPRPVRSMALVGAGVMGGGIAELASRSGIDVRVRDLQPAALTRALQTVRELVDERSRKRRSSASERDAQMARILPSLDLTGLKRVDFAMEAVVEDFEVKRRVFAELEVRMSAEAILATNTSSLSVGALAEGCQHPERFVGFHFFNPVHRMPLIEVVRGPATSDSALATAVALARRLGKTPVVVADAPGFVVNRILMPYLREAMHLMEDGYPLVDIDASMRRFGMPMGPFEVLDEVGLDVALKVAGVLTKAFPDRMTPSAALEKLVAAKRLGKKSGLGFYRHRGGKRSSDPALRSILGHERVRKAQNIDVLSERMVLAMINEAARCLEERVVSDAGMLDLAMIFGTGFPPYRGGLLRHADHLGLAHVEARLKAFRAEKGERFAPAVLLSRLAAAGRSFTGLGAPAG